MGIAAALLALALSASCSAARAVAPGQSPGPSIASPYLPAGHWAIEAARRVEGMGLAPRGFDPGMRSLPIGEVAWVLDAAAGAAANRDRREAGLIGGYLARFSEEFGPWVREAARTGARTGEAGAATASPADSRGAGRQDAGVRRVLAAGAVAAGYQLSDDLVLAGIGYSNIDDWTGPEPDQEIRSLRADALLAVTLQPWLAGGASPVVRDGGTELEDAAVVVQFGKLAAWGGRRAVGFGAAAGGAVVLAGDVALDGGGVFLSGPVRLPWILTALGPVRAETFLARLENGDTIRSPWFWSARIAFEPAERLRIGISRGAMFGGRGGAPVTLENLWLLLRGEHAGANGEFANQVFALDARYRLPVGVPLVATVEWGMDDLSGAWVQTPAVIAGLELAAVPGVPELAIGVERASFAGASTGNPLWYRNWAMRGGWTHERRPLGHALAGHGTEWAARARLDLVRARLRLDGVAAFRDRGEENLYAPERAGHSTLVGGGLAWRAGRRVDVSARGAVETGANDWRAATFRAGGRVLF